MQRRQTQQGYSHEVPCITIATNDTNENTQPEEQAPEQQSAQDTAPWEDKPVYTPDSSRNIRAKDEAE